LERFTRIIHKNKKENDYQNKDNKDTLIDTDKEDIPNITNTKYLKNGLSE
jgi:hypothetical protein